MTEVSVDGRRKLGRPCASMLSLLLAIDELCEDARSAGGATSLVDFSSTGAPTKDIVARSTNQNFQRSLDILDWSMS